jgi:hypothetical protein
MNKTILVGLAILTVSTSAASAWTNRAQERHAMKPHASAAAMKSNASTRALNANAAMTAPPAATPGAPRPMPPASSKDHEMYMKNLHDSGYDPKKDFTQSGTVQHQ